MSEDGFNTEIQGKVERLTQIGAVHGDVFIVPERVTRRVLPDIGHPDFATDVTDFIRVIVKSNRFGRRVEFRVPHEITAKAFIDLATHVLGLPWSKSVQELMISFSFRYSVVFNDTTLSLSQTLKDAGIVDRSEIQLSIRAVWTDEIEEAERREKEIGLIYHRRLWQLTAHEAARAARGRMTQAKIKSLADEPFKFIDKVPEN